MHTYHNQLKVKDLIRENFRMGSVLYKVGIDFQDFENQTIQEMCFAKNINARLVKNYLSYGLSKAQDFEELKKLPLPFLLRYLKMQHRDFSQNKLPYYTHLISSVQECSKENDVLIHDLKLIFPEFAKDFIRHIHNEEDTLFKYIETLLQAQRNSNVLNRIFWESTSISMSEFIHEHSHSDDLNCLNKLQTATLQHTHSLTEEVLLKELSEFDALLAIHEKVENELVFPMALSLENQLLQQTKRLTQYN